jgi:hypothetical protein
VSRLAEWTSGRRALALLFLLPLPLAPPRSRGADEIEYFAYLRSFVFDGDLEFGNEYRHFYERDPQGLEGFRQTFLERREPDTGNHINFAPLGTALLWSPFYLLAHGGVLAARAAGAGVAADGFAQPYVTAVAFASALLAWLGLLLIHDALRRYAALGEPAATLCVAALWLGTPLLYYTTLAPGFSHAASVFAVSLVAWLALRLDAQPETRLRDWALAGAAVGLAGLVREQDALYGVLPGGVLVWHTLRSRDWSRGVLRGAALLGTAVLVFSPQLLAYHAINGAYAPSRLVARKMAWWSPHFLEVLFSPGHGLFFWSPLLLLAVAGLGLALAGRRPPRVLPLLAAALLLQVWINGAVESWSQAGAFGSRRFVGASVLFAFGLGALFESWTARGARLPVAAVALLAAWWNVSLMIQFGLNLMDRQRLEWPKVALNQVTAVPQRLGRVGLLFFTDRERLVEESR